MEWKNYLTAARCKIGGGRRRILAAVVFAFTLTACAGYGASGGDDGGPGLPAVEPEAAAHRVTGGARALTIGTADMGGTEYLTGAAVATVINRHVPGVKVEVEVSKGSPVNAVNLLKGDIDLAMISGEAALSAYDGVNMFEGNRQEKLRALAGCYASLSGWAALEESGLEYVHDLKGREISSGPRASVTERASAAAFHAVGIDRDNTSIWNMDLESGTRAVGEGTLDAAHEFGSAPTAGQARLFAEKPARILKYTEQELDEIIEGNAFYYRASIPAGTYTGQNEEIPTFGVKFLLCVSADLEEELVYGIAKALAENVPDLSVRHAALAAMEDPVFFSSELPIPLHAGAEKYYREAGYIK